MKAVAEPFKMFTGEASGVNQVTDALVYNLNLESLICLGFIQSTGRILDEGLYVINALGHHSFETMFKILYAQTSSQMS